MDSIALCGCMYGHMEAHFALEFEFEFELRFRIWTHGSRPLAGKEPIGIQFPIDILNCHYKLIIANKK